MSQCLSTTLSVRKWGQTDEKLIHTYFETPLFCHRDVKKRYCKPELRPSCSTCSLQEAYSWFTPSTCLVLSDTCMKGNHLAALTSQVKRLFITGVPQLPIQSIKYFTEVIHPQYGPSSAQSSGRTQQTETQEREYFQITWSLFLLSLRREWKEIPHYLMLLNLCHNTLHHKYSSWISFC